MSAILNDAIGVGAALCSITSFTPQLAKIWREKASGQVSLRMYALTVAAFSLWSVYGALLGSWPLLAANLVSLALATAILVLQLRYRGREGHQPPPPRRRGR
jgi:MtN3 and saliva related transmembrane protein